ncbi:hypothetical protein AHF37_11671 [Paragonimus kellicotti]|nr:hypothetical protein AHF37_11671 [Paragonimus kellicotti]
MQRFRTSLQRDAHTNYVNLAACLPQPSVDQLAVELTSIATSWTTIARRDIPCSNCGILLALCDRANRLQNELTGYRVGSSEVGARGVADET